MAHEFGRPLEKLQLVALVPHEGAEFEERLIFTNLETAMKYWRSLPKRDCVDYVIMHEDPYSDGWVLSS